MEKFERITEERFDELLGVLPPVAFGKDAIKLLEGSGEDVSGWTDALIVGEAYSSGTDRKTGKCVPTFAFCFAKGGAYYKGVTEPCQEIAKLYYS